MVGENVCQKCRELKNRAGAVIVDYGSPILIPHTALVKQYPSPGQPWNWYHQSSLGAGGCCWSWLGWRRPGHTVLPLPERQLWSHAAGPKKEEEFSLCKHKQCSHSFSHVCDSLFAHSCVVPEMYIKLTVMCTLTVFFLLARSMEFTQLKTIFLTR